MFRSQLIVSSVVTTLTPVKPSNRILGLAVRMFFVLCFTLWSLCVTSPIFGIVTTLVIVMDDAIALKVSGVVHAGFSGNRKGRAERY